MFQIGERQSFDPDRAIFSHILDVEERDIRIQCWEEDHLVAVARQRGSAITTSFLAATLSLLSRSRGETSNIEKRRSQAGLRWNEGNSQSACKKSKAHVVVGVILKLNVALFDGPPESNTGGSETSIPSVGDFNSLDTPSSDEHIEALTVRMTNQMKVLDPLTDDLVNHSHGISVDGEPSDGNLGTRS